MSRTSPRIVAPYLLALALLSAPFWALAWLAASDAWTFGTPKAREWFVTGLMWCPGIAALLVCALMRVPYAWLGLRFPRGRWLWGGYLFPLAYLLVAYAIVWAGGFGRFDAAALAADTAKRYSLQASPAVLAVLGFAVTVTIGVLVEVGRSLGEELGWRGLLSPALVARHGLAIGGLASGAVWAAWHMPLLGAYGFDPVPAWYALSCFFVTVACVGYVCAWLRLRSGSVWPPVLLHASHNALLYPVFDAMNAPAGDITAYAAGETGFTLALASLLAAAWTWRMHMASGAGASVRGKRVERGNAS